MTVPTATDRLVLTPVTMADVDRLYALSSDPRVWTHLPSGRHESRAQTAAQVTRFVASWADHGLGYWLAHDRTGEFVGVGGCQGTAAGTWNVYYRVRPEQQRRGYAVEIAAAGVAAGHAVDPDRPVTAYLLEHNIASRATIERIGLDLVWRGPEPATPGAAAAVRLIYADRHLDPALLQRMIEHA
jgi:RimJ/RimL family protein N-acetyltransferase